MDFKIESTSQKSGRLGSLALPNSAKPLQTPCLLQSTKSGSIPHVSSEVYDLISSAVPTLEVPLNTIEHMLDALAIFPNKSISTYFGFPKSPVVLTLRDPCEQTPSGFNDKELVPLFTRRGKVCLDAPKYIKSIEMLQPDIYQGLSDADTDENSSNKRILKSVARTCKFMNYCYIQQSTSAKLVNCALFAPIVGGYCTYARAESVRHAKAAESSCQGYILEGFHKNGNSAMNVSCKKLLPMVSQCLCELDADKPRYMPGAYLPLVQLELIALGVDIFDTSLAYCLVMQFKALYFEYDIDKPKEDKPKLYIDLKDKAYKMDFTPFRQNCECIACKKHTRAYMHHLYNTQELLGPILLMIHNLHHMLQFYAEIRRCISRDTLPDLIELVRSASDSITTN